MLGYVQFYMALYFDDETATICAYQSDFRKPITEDLVELIAEECAKQYPDKLLKEYKCVSKEAYDAYSSLPNVEHKTLSWNDTEKKQTL